MLNFVYISKCYYTVKATVAVMRKSSKLYVRSIYWAGLTSELFLSEGIRQEILLTEVLKFVDPY